MAIYKYSGRGDAGSVSHDGGKTWSSMGGNGGGSGSSGGNSGNSGGNRPSGGSSGSHTRALQVNNMKWQVAMVRLV